MGKRNLKSNKSGQVIIVTALVVSVLFLSTAIYIIEVGKEVPTVEPSQSNLFSGYKQQITNTMISALANATAGNNPNILETDIVELKTIILANSYQAMLTMDYSILNSNGYKNGLLISWDTNGKGVSSACASFVFASSSISANSNIEYTLNVTSAMNSSGNCRQINDTSKQVNLTFNVMNEGKAALAQNVTVSYRNGVDWIRVDSPTITSFGNGTYKSTFNAQPSQPSDQMIVSLLCQDQRGIFVGTTLIFPTVSVSPTSWIMDIGQSKTFTATASNGSGNYTSYQWYVNGVVQFGETASTFSYSPVTAGSYSITLTVSDSLGATSAQSSATLVNVSASPTVSIAPFDPVTLDDGQSQMFTATPSGGSGSLSYQWYLDDGIVFDATGSTYSFNRSTGLYSVTCKVTDNASIPVTVQSNTVSVTVNSAPTVSVSPTSWIMDIGQSKTFTATASNGSGNYTSYQWYVNGVVQFGETASTFSYSPVTAGSYSITLTVSDSLGATSAQSSATLVNVSASPTVSIAPFDPVTLDDGQSQMFTATPSGGSGSLSYQWYLDDGIVFDATGSTYSFNRSTGLYSVTCKVTDNASIPVTVQSNTVSVTVNSAPTVSVSPTSWIMDIGQSKTFTATASNGSGNYTSYQWYVNGVVQFGETASTFSYSPVTAGSYSITLTVSDSLGATSAQSSATLVNVSASPTVSIAPFDPVTLDDGQSQMFTATPSGGSGSLSYQWYLDDGIVFDATGSTYSFNRSTGLYSVTCKVTDNASIPVTVQSNTVSVTVNSAPTVSVSPTSWIMDIGQSKTFTATASNGSGNYTSYQWYVNGVVQFGETASTFSYSPVTAGSYSITLTVSDSLGATSAQSSATLVNVSASPTVSIAPFDPVTLDDGQSQMFTATPSGGSGSLSYQWYLDDGIVFDATGSTYSFNRSTGLYSVTCKVTDNASIPVTVQSNTVSVTVNSAPTVSVSPTSWIMDIGQSKTFTATASNGSGNYTSYQWYVNGVVQFGETASTFSYSPVTAGSYSITLTVSDSLGATSAQSSATLVNVSASPTVSIAPFDPVTLDDGQSQMFTATPSGGSGSLSYQWYLDDGIVFDATGSTYSFNRSTGLYSVTCKVTDNASIPVTVQSNTVSVTVN